MNNYKLAVSAFHILVSGPLLIYLGNTKSELSMNANYLLLLLGIGIFGYHSYLVYKRGGINYGFINLLHVTIFAPLLIYMSIIGIMKKEVFWGVKKVFIMIGFAAIGYYILKLANSYN